MAFGSFQVSGVSSCDTFNENRRSDSSGQRIQRPGYTKRTAFDVQNPICKEQDPSDNDHFHEQTLYHMLKNESVTLPSVELIDLQPEIQWSLRPYLLDFLLEAHFSLQYAPTTMFLTVNIIDRYCSRHIVRLEHYQLVGCTAFLLAAKYAEKKDCVPAIESLRWMCGELYEAEMFLEMEWHMLVALDWMIGHPTIDGFLQVAVRNLVIYDSEVMHLALYISEISQFHRVFVSRPPSDLARASLALSQTILRRHPSGTEWASQYDPEIYASLCQHLHQPSQVLRQKYTLPSYSNVAVTLEQFLIQRAPPLTYACQGPSTEAQESEVDCIIMGKATNTGQARTSALITPPRTPE